MLTAFCVTDHAFAEAYSYVAGDKIDKEKQRHYEDAAQSLHGGLRDEHGAADASLLSQTRTAARTCLLVRTSVVTDG